jgi:hypothetical protein
MRRLAAGLRASFLGSEGIDHLLSRGEFRENELAELLRPHVPGRFGRSSGEVTNRTGESSRQQDLLITDAALASPFLSSGRLGVHPIESIYASLEIKTRVDRSGISDAVGNLASLKALQSSEPRAMTSLGSGMLGFGETAQKPFGGIVAFASDVSLDSACRAFLDASRRLPPLDRPNVLFVLDQFTVLWGTDDQKIELDPQAGQASLQVFEAGEDSILIFYVALSEWLRAYQPPPLDLLAYLNASGVSMGRSELRVGGS